MGEGLHRGILFVEPLTQIQDGLAVGAVLHRGEGGRLLRGLGVSGRQRGEDKGGRDSNSGEESGHEVCPDRGGRRMSPRVTGVSGGG